MDDQGRPIAEKQEKAHQAYVEQSLSPDEYFADGEAAAQAAALKKQKQVLIGAIGVLLALVVLIVYACQPPRGSVIYGVCSAFLDQVVHYPSSVQQLYVEQFPRAVRIYFNQTDAFGQFTQDMIECIADPNAFPDLQFSQVLYNRKPVDPDKVKAFNPTIPLLMASDMDLTLPPVPKDVLKSLHLR